MENQIILTPTTKADLVKEITANVLEGVSNLFMKNRETDLQSKEWLTANEVQDLLKISSVTRWDWSKKGILKTHKISGRLRFRKDEVLSAMIKKESHFAKTD